MVSKIFVYGTLQEEEPYFNHPAFVQNRVSVKKGKTKGIMFRLEWYPVIVKTDKELWIHGEIHKFKEIDKALRMMDEIEDFIPGYSDNSLYQRKITDVVDEDGNIEKCWIYYFIGETEGLERIDSGNWKDYSRQME